MLQFGWSVAFQSSFALWIKRRSASLFAPTEALVAHCPQHVVTLAQWAVYKICLIVLVLRVLPGIKGARSPVLFQSLSCCMEPPCVEPE